MNVKILNADTGRYIKLCGKLGTRISENIITKMLIGKKKFMKIRENQEVSEINQLDIDIVQKRLLVKQKRKEYDDQIKLERKAESISKNQLREKHYVQKLALMDKRLEQSIINKKILTEALKKAGLDLRSDSKLCQNYIDDNGKRTYKIDINFVVRRMCDMTYLYDYLDVTRYINMGNDIDMSEHLALKESKDKISR